MLTEGDNLTVSEIVDGFARLYADDGSDYWTTEAAGLNVGDNLTVSEVNDEQYILYDDLYNKYTIDR